MNAAIEFVKDTPALLILTASKISGGNIYTGPVQEIREVELLVRPKSLLRKEKKCAGLLFVMKWFIQIDLPPEKKYNGIRPLEKIQLSQDAQRRKQFELRCPFHRFKPLPPDEAIIQTGIYGETWSLLRGISARQIEEVLTEASDRRFP